MSVSADRGMRKHLGQLVGRKVTGLMKDSSQETDPIWALKFDDGRLAFIMSDPEGNGPGHLVITEAL